MSLHRCVVCRQYTLAQPLLVLGDRRPAVHVSMCVDCMVSPDVGIEQVVRPAHRALGWALWCLLTGRWCWSLAAPRST